MRGDALAHAPAIERRTCTFYGVGGAGTGAVMAGLTSFILLYYNLVLGVPAGLVGLAMALALGFDAISDPIVGYVSDGLHSRWGRRHPFMYAAVIPVSLLLYAVWNPPVELLGEQGLFFYLLATIVPLRLAVTLFEVPSYALIPELTTHYDERTKLAFYRTAFNFGAIVVVSILLYGYWLRNTAEIPNGLLNEDGYRTMGAVASVFAFGAMLTSSLWLHRFVPHLRQPPTGRARSLWGMLRSLGHTFSERDLLPLLGGGLLFSVGMGTNLALFTYIFAYYWELTTAQISGINLIWAVGLVVGFVVLQPVTRNREKKHVARVTLVALTFIHGGAVALHLVDAFPSPGNPWTYPLLLGFGFFDMLAYLLFMSTWSSMIADVVEVRELNTGHREEGAIYSAQTLITKASSALGVWVGGLVLELVAFPTGTEVSEVPDETIRNLGLVYVAAILIFYLLGFAVIGRYRLLRADHDAHLEALENAGTSRTSDGPAAPVAAASRHGEARS